MLNVVVPYENNTLHAGRYNYPATYDYSPASSRRQSLQSEGYSRSRRGSGYSTEDEDCHVLAEPITGAPPVIVFFSFMDKRSKEWALDHQVVNKIRRSVPQGTTITKYHAPMRSAWHFGEDLTHAWAVAESLEVDNKVIGPLFEAIHGKRIHDLEGIRTIFDECGIPPQMFLREWGKKAVIYETDTMNQAVEHVDLQHVPSILVHGKYMVKLDEDAADFSAERTVELVKKLLARQ